MDDSLNSTLKLHLPNNIYSSFLEVVNRLMFSFRLRVRSDFPYSIRIATEKIFSHVLTLALFS
jgi:hypothetical protein